MNLLILIHRLPFPADRGAKLRAALELGWLAGRHDVWCAGMWDPEDLRSAAGQAALQDLRTGPVRCREIFAVELRRPRAALRAARSLLTGRSATEGFFAAPALLQQVRTWSAHIRFDAVLAFSSSMAPLALQVPATRRVLDMVDLDSSKWAEYARSVPGGSPLRHLYALEARRLARGEREWIAAFDATVLVNAREAGQVSAGLRERVQVIETGHLTGTQPAATPGALPDEPVVGLVGAMDYAPNIDAASWFADAIWPLIRAHRPDARFCIVGRSPVRAVRELADLPGVEVTGTVPAVEPWLERMRVHVAPLRIARGVQTKVVAAMAAGRPCVVTPCVAAGIGAQPGRDYLVAQTPQAFAASVLDLFADRRRAQQIADSGRAFVRRRFDVQAGLSRLEALLLGHQTRSEQAA